VISITGVGGAGCRAVDQLAGNIPSDIKRACLDTDPDVLRQPPGAATLLIGEHTKPRPFHALPPDWSRMAAREDENRIARMVAGNALVIVIAGLGGGAGSGIAPALLEICKASGVLTVAVVSRPFTFEGRRRAATAMDALCAVEALADRTILVPCDRVRGMLAPGVGINGAFRDAAAALSIGARGIAMLMHGFADRP